MNDPARCRAVDHDLMACQLLGQLRIDADGKELAFSAWQRLLQRAPDRVGADGDVGDLALIKQGLEFTVGNRLDFRIARPKRLKQQNAHDRGEHVPDHNLAFASVRFHFHSHECCLFSRMQNLGSGGQGEP